MKGLFLCGYGCKPWIWAKIKEKFDDNEKNIKFIEWPTNLINDFNDIADFSLWVKDNFINEDDHYDFIVGHSMGGLISLQLSTMQSVNVKHVILVESYITSPGKFFQNILMENSDEIIEKRVLSMLKQESKFYSLELGSNLKNLDLTYLIDKTDSNIHCIYGDRGINNDKKVLNELDLSSTIQKQIDFKIVPNSCHFPMIENSEYLISVLKNILNKIS